MSYSNSGHNYISAPYYSTPILPARNHSHAVATPSGPDTSQKKRPKYTRSKTGCLTCRVKKVKCDEKKPQCDRCLNGQRDCTWPEGVSTRKKVVVKQEEPSERPGTGSSEQSEGSTPPFRDPTPPRRMPVDFSPSPIINRRPIDPYMPLHSMPHPGTDYGRHHHNNRGGFVHGYSSMNHPATSSNVAPMMPEVPTYHQTQAHYDPYGNHHRVVSGHVMSNSVRTSSMDHQQQQTMRHWHPPVMSNTNTNPVPQQYYHTLHERNMYSSSHHNHNQHGRYQ